METDQHTSDVKKYIGPLEMTTEKQINNKKRANPKEEKTQTRKKNDPLTAWTKGPKYEKRED